MSKRPLGHGDLRNMGNFKAIAMDYEYYLTLLDEGRLYCLTDQQVYILLAQLDYVGWLTRWYNTSDITQTTVGYIRSDLEKALLSCVDVQILIDQANENLITTVTNRALQSQAIRDGLAAEYDGTPTSINPDAPTTTWSYSGTDDGNAALCAALMAFVYQFARSQADSVRAGQIGGLAAIGLIAALLIPGLNIFFLVGAGIAVLLGAGVVGVTTEVAIAALTDTTALDAVVCCMKDNLEGASVSEASWAGALGSCGFAGGSHEQIVADFLGATLADNYLTFLDFMGTGFAGVTGSESVPECPCEPPAWEKVWDFGAGDTAGWTLNRGVYQPTVGYHQVGSGTDPYTVDLERNITWGTAELTEIAIDVASENADGGAFRGVYYPSSAFPSQSGYTGATGIYTMTFTANNPQPPTVEVQVSNQTVPGYNYMFKVTFRGNGPEPTW